jgi:initiation factor 1A
MVKNSTGGNKSKKQARSSTSYTPQQNIRKAKEGEMYATVTKMLGTGCLIMCIDGISRSCIIRNKFKTKGKRDNIITVGSWILVGIREWEIRSNGTQKCDLLEVYSHSEKDRLKQIEVCDFKHLNIDNNENTEKQLEFSSSYLEPEPEEPEQPEQPESSDEESSDEESITKIDELFSKMSLKDLMKTPKKEISHEKNKDNNICLSIDDI